VRPGRRADLQVCVRPGRRADLPPSPRLRRTAVALAEAGQVCLLQSPACMITDRPRRLEGFSYVGLQRYFVTTCTAYRQPIFSDAAIANETHERILDTSREFEFAIAAYCFMPDHLHLLLMAQSEQSDLPRLMKQAKQVTGFDYRRQHENRCGNRVITIGSCAMMRRRWPSCGTSWRIRFAPDSQRNWASGHRLDPMCTRGRSRLRRGTISRPKGLHYNYPVCTTTIQRRQRSGNRISATVGHT